MEACENPHRVALTSQVYPGSFPPRPREEAVGKPVTLGGDSSTLGLSTEPVGAHKPHQALRVLVVPSSTTGGGPDIPSLLNAAGWEAEPCWATPGPLPEGDFDLAIVDVEAADKLPAGFFVELKGKLKKRILFLSAKPLNIDWLSQVTGYSEKMLKARLVAGTSSPQSLARAIRKALSGRHGRGETMPPNPPLPPPITVLVIIGQSPAIKRVAEDMRKAGSGDAIVLITGETGTGKELVARAIYRDSPRAERPFVEVNCAAIPKELIESELFGHERGAFTGAVGRRIGRFEEAHGGTLFLDEVGDLALDTQAKLLRAIEGHGFYRLGGNELVNANARILAATNHDLEAAQTKGSFRKDLYYRLNVVRIDLPPLRHRQGDIPLLAEHFLKAFSAKCGKEITGFGKSAMEILEAHDWPGNVRELEHAIERAVIMSQGRVIKLEDLGISLLTGSRSRGVKVSEEKLNMREATRRLELEFMGKALTRANGNHSEATRLLGVSRRRFRVLFERYQEEEAYRAVATKHNLPRVGQRLDARCREAEKVEGEIDAILTDLRDELRQRNCRLRIRRMRLEELLDVSKKRAWEILTSRGFRRDGSKGPSTEWDFPEGPVRHTG